MLKNAEFAKTQPETLVKLMGGSEVRCPKRMPSDAGVTFEGFQDIRIPSRTEVKKKLDSFMTFCKKSKSPAIRVLLGWWGEGKTDAYSRYIMPEAKGHGDIPLFLSASTLANNYRVEQTQKLFEKTTLSASRFLIAVMNGLRDEQPDLELASTESYSDPDSFIEDSLEHILSKGKKKSGRVFVFIDEFEELLLDKNLNEIISGLKETINPPQRSGKGKRIGRDLIHQRGKFAGRVHFVVACTPDAHYRLQVDADTSLVFGGLGRRQGVIELSRITKKEGIDFLYELIKYSYEGKIPNGGPISSMGILESLLRASQSNLGNLVSLMTRLMSEAENAASKKCRIRVIDPFFLMSFLEGEQVSIYGSQTPCIEKETLDRFNKLIREQKRERLGEICSRILFLFLGDQRPLSVDEISELTKYSEKDIKNAIGIINGNLRTREGIEGAIIRLSPMTGRSLEELFREEFQSFVKREGDLHYIRIDDFSELLSDFRDRLTHFRKKGKGLTLVAYLPTEPRSAQPFYEGIGMDRARELANLARRLCGEDTLYTASERLLSQIFPTPVPKQLEFLKNRDKRLRVWREVTRNLAERYEASFVEAFVDLASLMRRYDFTLLKQVGSGGTSLYKVHDDDTESRFTALIASVPGDLKSTDVEDIAMLLRKKPPVHLAIVFHTGDVLPEAEDKIRDKGLGSEGDVVIMPYKVHQTLVKLILCFHLASVKYSDELDREKYQSESVKLTTDDLGFSKKLNTWMAQKEQRGLVLKDLEISVPSLKEFANSLKFYLNFPNGGFNVKDIFDKNRKELLRFVKFGSKLGLIPDIESDKKLGELTRDLERNGFLELSKKKYSVVKHPTEKRLTEILVHEKKCTINEIEAHFVLRARMRKLLEDVYLSILDYRGLVQKDKRLWTIVDPGDAKYDLDIELRKLTAKERLKNISDYGHVFVVKERGKRLILLEDLKKQIGKFKTRIEKYEIEGREERMLQTVSVLRRLLKHFSKELWPLMESATKEGRRLVDEISKESTHALEDLEILKDNCDKWLRIRFNLDKLREYEKISGLLDDVKQIQETQSSEDVLAGWVSDMKKGEIEEFRFDRTESDAYYHNIKLCKISKLIDDLNEIIGQQKRFVERYNDLFGELAEEERKFKKKHQAIKLSGELTVCNYFLERAGELGAAGAGLKETRVRSVSISKLMDIVEEHHDRIMKEYKAIRDCLTEIEELVGVEEGLLEEISKTSNTLSKGRKLLDTDEAGDKLKESKEEYDRITKGFERNFKALSVGGSTDNLLKKIRATKKMLEDKKERIENIGRETEDIWTHVQQDTRSFLRRIGGVLEAIGKKKKVKISSRFRKVYKTLEDCSRSSLGNLDKKLSVIEKTKLELRRELYSMVANLLTGDELKILEIVVQQLEDTEGRWIKMSPIYGTADKLHGMKEDSVDKWLKKLLKDGFLEAGVSLKA